MANQILTAYSLVAEGTIASPCAICTVVIFAKGASKYRVFPKALQRGAALLLSHIFYFDVLAEQSHAG